MCLIHQCLFLFCGIFGRNQYIVGITISINFIFYVSSWHTPPSLIDDMNMIYILFLVLFWMYKMKLHFIYQGCLYQKSLPQKNKSRSSLTLCILFIFVITMIYLFLFDASIDDNFSKNIHQCSQIMFLRQNVK